MSVAISSPGLSGLARDCLELLNREEAALTGFRQAIQQLRAALVSGDPKVVEKAIQSANASAAQAEECQQRLAQFRAATAAALGGSPETVTVRSLAAHLPAAKARQLLEARSRLNQLAEEIQRLHRSNAFLAQYGLDFLQSFLAALTGTERNRAGYGPAGQSVPPVGRPIISLRG